MLPYLSCDTGAKIQDECLSVLKQISPGKPVNKLMLSRVANKNMLLFYYPERHGAFANKSFGTTVGHCASIAGHCAVIRKFLVPSISPGLPRTL